MRSVEKSREDRLFPPPFVVAVIVVIPVIPTVVTVAVIIAFQEGCGHSHKSAAVSASVGASLRFHVPHYWCGRAFDDLVEFPSVESDTPARRTEGEFDPAPVRHRQARIANRAQHGRDSFLSSHDRLSFLPLAREAQPHLKQVDEVEIKGVCSHDL